MAELTYRQAVSAAIAQEMERDESVVLLGEDVGAAGGVFKTYGGLFKRFGPDRVRDTPISEEAIVGAAIGAAMTGLRPVADIMFADFLATCWDMITNEAAKARYMFGGQFSVPMVVVTGNGGGLRFGAQHSQSLENWAMAVPGLKVVAPATPGDAFGLLAAAVRDPDPVMYFGHKALYAMKEDVPDGEQFVPLGRAAVRRSGKDVTLLALGAMVGRALEAAELLAIDGIEATVVDLRTLVPLDTATIFETVCATGVAFTVEENPRLLGWGAEIASLVAEECFDSLDAPVVRITAPHVPLAAAAALEDLAIPSAHRIHTTVRATCDGGAR
jgi:pyruvate dehydrogenase E1 component beta subunit